MVVLEKEKQAPRSPKNIYTHAFKDLVFKEELNPAIKFFKEASLWVIDNVPDITQWTGIKMALLNVFWILLGVSFLFWIVQELYSPWAILIKLIILSMIAALVFSNLLASMVYSFLYIWEDKGTNWFRE